MKRYSVVVSVVKEYIEEVEADGESEARQKAFERVTLNEMSDGANSVQFDTQDCHIITGYTSPFGD